MGGNSCASLVCSVKVRLLENPDFLSPQCRNHTASGHVTTGPSGSQLYLEVVAA